VLFDVRRLSTASFCLCSLCRYHGKFDETIRNPGLVVRLNVRKLTFLLLHEIS
jgi:hypothetical protein